MVNLSYDCLQDPCIIIVQQAGSSKTGEPEDDKQSPGGHAARRLEDFLKGRLPPGSSPEELNPEIAKEKKETGESGADHRDGNSDAEKGDR